MNCPKCGGFQLLERAFERNTGAIWLSRCIICGYRGGVWQRPNGKPFILDRVFTENQRRLV